VRRKVLNPPSTSSPQVNGSQRMSPLRCIGANHLFQGIKQKPMPSPIPEVPGLHLGKRVERGGIVFIVPMLNGLPWDQDAVVLFNEESLIRIHRSRLSSPSRPSRPTIHPPQDTPSRSDRREFSSSCATDRSWSPRKDPTTTRSHTRAGRGRNSGPSSPS